ncbi:regulator of G-protein signaling 9-binding protein [Gouania willdenowi]|uniref:regulator of G-protein signaling 9-binding protein n=1 Tax=Gouania willdenowi TaxID=441366 RepID=UPI001056A40B|nr:regulator of G-protein signaling 9-binding protein B-like [Gouania willdenowi]
MPLVNNKVGNDCTLGKDKGLADEKAQVDSLMKVVACHRHLASCVGGCTDGLQLRDELRQTREKAQKLATAICQRLTLYLRDKSLAPETRKELEILWVSFSSSLELFHVDMCKVYNVADIVSVGNAANLVKTGLQGGGSEVAARALSWSDLNQVQTPTITDGLELQERCTMEKEITHIDHMIEDMELKVNVLRWMVEPRQPEGGGGGEGGDPLSSSSDTASLALLSVDEEQLQPHTHCHQSHIFIFLLLLTVVLVAITLSVCLVLFS